LPEEELSKLRNNPTAILEFIDQYGTEKFMMNVGEVKGFNATSISQKIVGSGHFSELIPPSSEKI
jgi:hypothetical protein